jgi:SAM-dependent methyltransferase
METVPCIFGHGFSDDVAIEENGFEGRRCPACGLIYISPRPEPSEVLNLYYHDRAHLAATNHLRLNPAAELAAAAHFGAIYNTDRYYHAIGEEPLSILEIGCGGGHLLKRAKAAGLEAFGVELNPRQAEFIRNELGIACDTKPFSRNTFGQRKFDIIFHCDVTSHLHDPIGDFTIMREKLKPYGQLVFETGNGADIDPRYYKYFNCWQYPDHLFFFGEASIRELLRRAGFSRVQIVSWSILPELVFTRLLKREKRRRVDAALSTAAPDTAPVASSKRSKMIKLIVARIMHAVRFNIGALSSNRSVPRTMLIWAMK